MPISPYLKGHRFDQETRRVLGLAFEMVCITLRVEDCDDGVKQAIATKIIDLVKTGQHSPDLLCEQVLKDIRTPGSVESPLARRPRAGSAVAAGAFAGP